MKAFLEEYGVIVVAAIVIMLIVVFATPLGEKLKAGIANAIDKVTAKLEAGLGTTNTNWPQQTA